MKTKNQIIDDGRRSLDAKPTSPLNFREQEILDRLKRHPEGLTHDQLSPFGESLLLSLRVKGFVRREKERWLAVPSQDDGCRPQDGAYIRLQGDPDSFVRHKLVQRKDGIYLTFYTPEDPDYPNSSPVKMKASDFWQAKVEAEKLLSRDFDDGEPIELLVCAATHGTTCKVCFGRIKKGEIICASGFPFYVSMCSECIKAGNIDERLKATAKRQRRERDGEAVITKLLIGRLIVPTYEQWKAAAKAERREPEKA